MVFSGIRPVFIQYRQTLFFPCRQKLALFTSHRALRRELACGLLLALWCGGLSNARAQNTESFSEIVSQAAAARDAGDIPLAIGLYTRTVQLKPDWKEGWWNLGVLQYNSGQYAGGIDAFTHLLQLIPTAPPAMALRGLCEFETGAYDDSLRDLEMSVAHGAANDPRNEQNIRFHLAQLLAHAGKFQGALDQYQILATRQLTAPDMMIGISLAGMWVRSFSTGIPEDDRELYQATGSAAYSFLGGNSQKADDLFAEIFASHPTTPHLHFLYGFLLFPHDSSLAADQLRKELIVNPNDENANSMLALALVLGGQFKDALEPAKRAYTFAPKLEITQLALGRALAETGDRESGEELLRKVIERDPGSLEAHLGLASIYSQNGNREEANHERKICHELAK